MGEYAPLIACTFVVLAAVVSWLIERRQTAIRKHTTINRTHRS